jgi:hypothetical protein
LAGFTLLLVVLAGFALAFAGVALAFTAGVVAGVLAGVEVLTGAGVFAGLLAFALFAASPQAIPRALNPRTVESTITFVILFKTPNLTQRIKTCFQASADRTQPFCPELFPFQGKRYYRNRG